MKIRNIDHFVITTADLQACLDFYVGLLGMEHREHNGHHNLYFHKIGCASAISSELDCIRLAQSFPNGKISIHTRKGEFPANELKALPFETGEIKEHKNKFGKIASIVSGVAEGIGGLGMLGALAGVGGNSASAILTGVRVAGTAANVSSLADIGNNLAGAEGHDFTYKGSSSKLVVAPEGKDLKILVNLRCENKESGPSLLKVVRFKQTKSDRRLRWFQTKAALINTDKSDDADKAGYLSFGFENYGEHCSVLTIPSSELEKGEYGVYFLGNMFGPSMAILCYTFSVQ